MPPHQQDPLVDLVYQKRQIESLSRGPRVVALGGGTGLSTLLAGLKFFTSNITAIVTVTDTGGSSGRLRDEMDVLPPGDIRNCLVALADAEPLIRDLFQYRFREGEGLTGHSFGNLFITALSKVTGDFEKAIRASSKVLAIRGRVIPSSLEKVTLVGEFDDGTVAEGETHITEARKRLRRIRLKPADCSATPEALEAIENAEVVILGPGSLYTSVLPNVLIPEIREALLKCEAYKVFVVNIMTQPGETDGYSAYDHVRVFAEHADPRLIDVCIANVKPVPPGMIYKYREQGAELVHLDLDHIREKGYEVIEGSLLKVDGQVRHDPPELSRVILDHYAKLARATA